MGVLQDWQVTYDDLDEVVTDNPSLRGMLFGYVAEVKCRKIWFARPEFTDVVKYVDHDRQEKADIGLTYRNERFRIEVKSLQTNTVQLNGNKLTAKFQCDASDRRTVTLAGGQTVQTTCLLVGQFDILAVNLFAFEKKWRFAFARNNKLPLSQFRGYTEDVRKQLLATLMPVTWPLELPYVEEPFSLFDEIVQERASQKR